MKKIVYLLAILGLAFTGCEPLEDINAEIDALNATTDFISGDVVFALSDEDYEDLDISYGNFNSIEDAKTMIPGLLADKYPVWGNGSSALVTFAIYEPKRNEKSLIIYEVTTEDYDANPDTEEYDNFDEDDQIYEFLNTKYPDPEDRVLVSLTYKFYNGGLKTLNDGFLYTDGEWVFIQGFTEDEYEAMGEGFPNFSYEDEAFAKIPIFLKDKFKYDNKSAGDVEGFMYKLYVDGVTESYVVYFAYDGSYWSKYENVVNQTIQFGHDGTVWVPDNTIKYTLAGSDYVFIGESLADTYPDPAGSAENYSNFDRREGNDNYWSNDMLVEAMGVLLNNIDASAAEGQKYVLSFDIYNGAAGIEELSVIKTDGEWVLN